MATTTMNTVDKALSLLRHFSVQTPELGLSELARIAGYDKTTTLRCMTALERNGFVEQDEDSRKYRLGLAPINLAQIREQSFPVQAVLRRYLDELSHDLGETAHASLVVGQDYITAAISEPERALRVHLDPSERMPFHATASGLAITAFMPPEMQAQLLAQGNLEVFTAQTPTDPDRIRHLLDTTRRTGIARAAETYEQDVVGSAAPVFGPRAHPVGAIAVAAVSHRLTPDLRRAIDTALRRAAQAITRDLGGRAPATPTHIQQETTV